MRLLDGIYLVGSGRLGFTLTDASDCHVYLLASNGDAVLIDAGCGRGAERILRQIEATGINPTQVSRILLTHAHADHAGGAAVLANLLRAEVWAPARSAHALCVADEEAIGLRAARQAGLYPADYRLAPTPVHRRLEMGEVRVGDVTLSVLPTPGHSADHLAYSAMIEGRQVLFSGDLVFARGRVALLATRDCDLQAYVTSMKAAAAVSPDVLFPGHGEVVMTDAASHVAEAIDLFALGSIPPLL